MSEMERKGKREIGGIKEVMREGGVRGEKDEEKEGEKRRRINEIGKERKKRERGVREVRREGGIREEKGEE